MSTSASEETEMKAERTTRRSSRVRVVRCLAAAAAAALLVGVLPAVAGATDYCVDTDCGGTNVQSFEQALGLADDAPDADRIFLGAATYTAPTASGYAYSTGGPVEIIGQGVGQTVLTGPAGAFSVLSLYGGAGSSVHDLTIRLPQNAASGARGLATEDEARRIEVVEDPVQANQRTGVLFEDGGTLEDSTVTLSDLKATTAVGSGDPSVTVRRSALRASTAFHGLRGGTIERSRLTGGDSGVAAHRGVTTVTGSLIRFTQAAGVGIVALTTPGAHPILNADGVTIVGPGLPNTQGAGVGTEPAGTQSADLNLANSIIRGVGRPLVADAAGPGQARIAVSYSDYDPTGNLSQGAGSITPANVSNVGDARFVDAAGGDYRLLPGSPLLDAGDPAAAQGLDLDCNPLIADGDGDGIARRDLGAFELPPALTGGGSGGGGPGQQSDTPAGDTVAPLVGGFRATPALFAVARAGTPLAARVARGTRFRYTLSEAARVTLKIQRALPGRRARYRTVGTLKRTAAKGANRISFSGRIGRRALRRGPYRALIRAVDAARNRSSRRTARFRVARG
jgi:hypothetical protein